MTIWQVRGRRLSVTWRVILETESMPRAAAHLARLRQEFLGLTEYECVAKETLTPPPKHKP